MCGVACRTGPGFNRFGDAGVAAVVGSSAAGEVVAVSAEGAGPGSPALTNLQPVGGVTMAATAVTTAAPRPIVEAPSCDLQVVGTSTPDPQRGEKPVLGDRISQMIARSGGPLSLLLEPLVSSQVDP